MLHLRLAALCQSGTAERARWAWPSSSASSSFNYQNFVATSDSIIEHRVLGARTFDTIFEY